MTRCVIVRWRARDDGFDVIPEALLGQPRNGASVYWQRPNGTFARPNCDIAVNDGATELKYTDTPANQAARVYLGTLRLTHLPNNAYRATWKPRGEDEFAADGISEVLVGEVQLDAPEADDAIVPQQVEQTTYRYLRDTDMARRVKLMHGFRCQIAGCGQAIQLPDGRLYIEAHHLRALRHGGQDVASNIICVCPNHHVELDYFCRELAAGDLVAVAGHTVDADSIAFHNDKYQEHHNG